jgi:hypothetical protein
VDDSEDGLVDVLNQLNAMWVEETGLTHPMIDSLLDPVQRRSARTLNYLTATASGTLRDRIFCELNHDPTPAEGFTRFNERYQGLLHEAVDLAVALDLPAARDGGW